MNKDDNPTWVTREQIRNAYIFMLGREPESETAYEALTNLSDLYALRAIVLSSEEYKARVQMVAEARSRSATIFIHLEKTGGTTLHNILAAYYAADQVAPSHYGFLRDFVFLEGIYDLYSCHIDYETALAIPKASKRFVSLFRRPIDRLISEYRFWRSHPTGEQPEDIEILAKALSPEEFFDHPYIRTLSVINNYYLHTFGPPNFSLISATRTAANEAIQIARRRIKILHALGITDRMEESVEIICRTLGFEPPIYFETFHRTDNFPSEDPRFATVPGVELTPQLRRAMEDLTCYDDLLFDFAVAEFDRRIEAAGTSPKPEPRLAGSR
jgi:hypothetical protein